MTIHPKHGNIKSGELSEGGLNPQVKSEGLEMITATLSIQHGCGCTTQTTISASTERDLKAEVAHQSQEPCGVCRVTGTAKSHEVGFGTSVKPLNETSDSLNSGLTSYPIVLCVSSNSDPDKAYAVVIHDRDFVTCSCKGFQYRKTCKHSVEALRNHLYSAL